MLLYFDLFISDIKPLTIHDIEPRISDNRVVVGQEDQPFFITCLGSKDNVPPSLITWKNVKNHLVNYILFL